MSSFFNRECDVLFHDAVATRDYATQHKSVNNFVEEIKERSDLDLIRDIGSIRHYKFKKNIYAKI